MGREWKPGDVAMVNGDICLLTSRGQWEHGRSDRFAYYYSHSDLTSVRPLVVIDPEDREQVTRLWIEFAKDLLAHSGDEEWDGISAMQRALREFADPKPPKPEEPLGLGAVVEDSAGVHWVSAQREDDTDPCWYGLLPDEGMTVAHYSDIDAVTVLSEGVQP